jgi:diguanylate cyclase (GGDEF)-like protein/PAS domain S-box-containing protein
MMCPSGTLGEDAVTDDGSPSALPLAQLLDELPDIVIVIAPDGTIAWANREAERRLGWLRSEWLGRNALDLVHPDDLGLALVSLETTTKRIGAPGTLIDIRVLDAEGRWRYLEARGELTDDRLALVLRDTTDRRSLELSSDDDLRFRALVHYSATITMLLDGRGKILTVNGTVTRLLGLDPELLRGTELSDWVAPEAVSRLRHDVDRAMTTASGVIETVFVGPGGRPIHIEFRAVNLLDDPVVCGVILSGHDVTQLVEARVALEHLARHDTLTGLANRVTLDEHLRLRLSTASMADRTAVVFVDLDRFKAVNDYHGHDAGDRVLVEVANRLTDAVRPPDLVARFGGDEFVVVAHDVPNPKAAAALSERIARALNTVVQVDDRPVALHASVGFAMAGLRTPEDVLADADASMYAMKESRRRVKPGGRVPEARRWVVAELPSAIERGELVVHYQPVIAIADHRVVGYEALVRWEHPSRGQLEPAVFLGVAEECGLAPALGELVVRQALQALSRWNRAVNNPLWVSVNLSPSQFLAPDLADVLERLLLTTDADPQQLWVEINEPLALDRSTEMNSGAATERIEGLQRLGIRLMIDDFGTGYTSLLNLRRFPASALKIERSFVADLTPANAAGSIVDAMIQLGATLGLDVVAEGVETHDQLEALAAIGCPMAQGYLVGVPGPDPSLTI